MPSAALPASLPAYLAHPGRRSDRRRGLARERRRVGGRFFPVAFSLRSSPPVVTGDSAGAGAEFCDAACGSVVAAAVAAACGDAAAGFCRAIAPVTESSPCSSTVTREYSRSRSPLSVSIAEASRRASFWLSLATDWICCDCRARSAAATWSRRKPDRRLAGEQRDDDRADRGNAPRSQPPQRAPVELILLGQKPAQQAAGIFGLEAASQMVAVSLAIRRCRPS